MWIMSGLSDGLPFAAYIFPADAVDGLCGEYHKPTAPYCLCSGQKLRIIEIFGVKSDMNGVD